MPYRSAALVILDGFGSASAWGGNAIAQARAPFLAALEREPNLRLAASGSAVGLPGNERGNSEVGHLNIGAGRVVIQDSTRINEAITDGSFWKNPVLLSTLRTAARTKQPVHLLGLLTTAAVHASFDHLVALLELAAREKVTTLNLHLFTDGRDMPPRDSLVLVDRLEKVMAGLSVGVIRTICGRYYAMDRDHHWDRTERAAQVILAGTGVQARSARAAVAQAYAAGQTDEFIEPTVIDNTNEPYPGVRANDVMIFWNFRSDRARQLTDVLVGQGPATLELSVPPVTFISLTPYGAGRDHHGVTAAFAPPVFTDTLPDIIASEGHKQFHIAESEKYAHVTYFLNGNKEDALPGEERSLIPSIRTGSFDQTPAMRAAEITRQLVRAMHSQRYQLYVANYANADMVGHTGNFQAVVTAIQAIDRALEELVRVAHNLGIPIIITADHGNAEQMVNPQTGEPSTDHTTNPVPCYVVLPQPGRLTRTTGVLADIAPSILTLLGIEQPAVMTGTSFIA